MNELCNITQPHYLRALLQLLPRGYAWEWDDNSAGRRVLAIVSSELHRVHELLCSIARYNIDRFALGVTGWSAPDYERLLTDKFGVAVPFVRDNDHYPYPLLAADYRNKYVFRIRSQSPVTPAAQVYLRAYAQSHTAPHITRDYRTAAGVASAVVLRQSHRRAASAAAINLRPTASTLYVASRVLMRQTLTRRLTA